MINRIDLEKFDEYFEDPISDQVIDDFILSAQTVQTVKKDRIFYLLPLFRAITVATFFFSVVLLVSSFIKKTGQTQQRKALTKAAILTADSSIKRDVIKIAPKSNGITYPTQFVKFGYSVQFGDFNVRLIGFDSNNTAVTLSVCRTVVPYVCNSVVSRFAKVSKGNPFVYTDNGTSYVFALDSVRKGYGPNKENPAAFVQLKTETH